MATSWGILGLRPAVAAALCASSAICLSSGEECGMSRWWPITALGDSQPAAQPDSSVGSQDSAARLKEWLVQQGADISRIDFRPSQVGPEAGVGVFVAEQQPQGAALESRRRRWWAPWTRTSNYAVMADFPLATAITAANILGSGELGQRYGWLVSRGALDERQVVQAYLAVEHARGHTSPLAPWLDALPRTFHSPLMWSEQELWQLRGTTLGRATHALRSRLEDSWRSVLQPALTQLCKQLGSPRPPTLADLMWAHCVFWSRGQSLPVPLRAGPASHLIAEATAAAAGRSRSPSVSQTAAVHQLVDVHEGIVPGLDFANHRSHNPGCWWEVVQSQAHSTRTTTGVTGTAPSSPLQTASVRLQLHQGWRAKPGDELTINYGTGKSNEELLLLYGFVHEEGSREDCVMLAYPVPPPAQWDDAMAARMELLTSSGMRPQCFLKAAHISPAAPAPQAAVASATAQEAAGVDGVAPVSPEVLEALEVFVLEPKEVSARLEALRAQHRARRQGYTDVPAATTHHLSGAELDLAAVGRSLKQRGARAPTPQQLDTLAVQLGLRMAALSTYVRLLEVQLVELEGSEQGTGSLEADMQLLAQHRTATAPGAAAQGVLPYRTWCAVVYRAGQKRVVRAHLVGARQELQQVMALLAQLQDLQQQQQQAQQLP